MIAARNPKRQRYGKRTWLLAVAFISLPVVMTAAVLFFAMDTCFHLDTCATHLVPGSPDEIRYYLQIRGTAHVGFDIGYFTIEEYPAPAQFLHYGPHGPVFPLLYGAVAALTGWPPYAAMFVNVGVWMLALAVLLVTACLDRRQMLLMAVVIATFFPALMFWPSNMQESLHQAIGILLAAGFYRLLTDKQRKLQVGLVALLVFASLLRYTWAFFIPILLVLSLPHPTPRRITLALAQSAALALAAFLVFTVLASPVKHNFITEFVEALPDSPSKAAGLFHDNLTHNARFLVGLDSGFGKAGWIVLVMMAFALLIPLLSLTWAKSISPPATAAREAMFHVFNLLPVVFLALVLYDSWQGYRTLSAHVLASLVLLVLTRRFWPVILFAAVSLLCLPLFPKLSARYFDVNLFYPGEEIQAFADATAPFLRYDPETSDPWCNTVLVSVSSYNYRLTKLEPGLGAAMLYDVGSLILPPRSKYLLLSSQDYAALKDRLTLAFLSDTPNARLYYSPASGCPTTWEYTLAPKFPFFVP